MMRNNKVYKLSYSAAETMSIGTIFSGTSDTPSAVVISIPNIFGRFRLIMPDFHEMLSDFIGHIDSGRDADLQCRLSTAPNELYHIEFGNHIFCVKNKHGVVLYTGKFDTITDVSISTYM